MLYGCSRPPSPPSKPTNQCSECQRGQRDGRSLQNGLYPPRGQADRASGSRPGVETPDTPPSAGYFPPLLREGVAAERIQGLLCQELRSIALAVEAPAEMDIRPVGLTFVHVIPAALKPTLHVSRIFSPTLGLRDARNPSLRASREERLRTSLPAAR
jgi:hypothetical protein